MTQAGPIRFFLGSLELRLISLGWFSQNGDDSDDTDLIGWWWNWIGESMPSN